MAKMQLPDSVVAAAKANELWAKEADHVASLIDSATNGAYACLKEAHSRKDLPSQLAANDQIIRIAELKARTLNTFYTAPREENGSEDA